MAGWDLCQVVLQMKTFFQYRELYNADVIAADISISQPSTGINLHYTNNLHNNEEELFLPVNGDISPIVQPDSIYV